MTKISRLIRGNCEIEWKNDFECSAFDNDVHYDFSDRLFISPETLSHL